LIDFDFPVPGSVRRHRCDRRAGIFPRTVGRRPDRAVFRPADLKAHFPHDFPAAGRASAGKTFFDLDRICPTPAVRMSAKKESRMTNKQLELGFNEAGLAAVRRRSQSKSQRAAWWFARMRQIVANAVDWPSAGEPRPEQTWLPGSRREVRV
jgi:hypothetical protein